MNEPDLVIVGAGISGATLAAQAARRGLRSVVLEREAAPGGCLQSLRPERGFWIELGAHTCYSSYRSLLSLLDSQARCALLPRTRLPFRVLREGALRPIWRELSLLELLRCAPRVAWAKQRGQTVRSYYSRIVGPRNYARLFSRLFAAVPSQDADEFPAELLFKRRPRRKDVPRSFTVDGGLQTIVEMLLQRRRVHLETGFDAVTVRRSGRSFVVRGADDRLASARLLAVALPPSRAAALLADSFPEVAATLAQIRTVQVDSVGLVLPSHAARLERVAGIIPLDDDRLCSVVSRDVVPDRARRGFTAHFRPGLDASARLARACEVLGVSAHQLQHVAQRSVLMPAPTLGHSTITETLDRLTAGTGLALTGNYFGGLSIEDCVRRSSQEARRLCAVHPEAHTRAAVHTAPAAPAAVG